SSRRRSAVLNAGGGPHATLFQSVTSSGSASSPSACLSQFLMCGVSKCALSAASLVQFSWKRNCAWSVAPWCMSKLMQPFSARVGARSLSSSSFTRCALPAFARIRAMTVTLPSARRLESIRGGMERPLTLAAHPPYRHRLDQNAEGGTWHEKRDVASDHRAHDPRGAGGREDDPGAGGAVDSGGGGRRQPRRHGDGRAGTYHEAGRPCPTEPATCAVVVSTDGIRLVGENGAGAVILENAGGQEQGIAVAKGGASGPSCLTDSTQRVQGAVVQGFTVNGFDGDGIFLLCVDNWRVEGNSVNNNAEYGIFPSHCGPGEIVHNVATGSNDTGIYFGQSHDVRVDHNLATGNVSGFELQNSSNSRVDHNTAMGNTGGILTF